MDKITTLNGAIKSITGGKIKKSWEELFGKSHQSELDQLIYKYNEPHRFYHNLTHIEYGLEVIDNLTTRDIANISTLQTAWIFHDCIYQGDPEDEKLSGEYAKKILEKIGSPSWVCTTIPEIITNVYNMPPTALLNDIDYLILSERESAYDQYSSSIKKEYDEMSRKPTQKDYAKKRCGFLLSQLYTRIYKTNFFSDRENQAKQNIKREIISIISNYKVK